MAVTVFLCGDPNDPLFELRGLVDESQEPPESEDDCVHCGTPLDLDEYPYKQHCSFCGRSPYDGGHAE